MAPERAADRINKGARSASEEHSIARAMCRVREKRIPRRGSSEPSGRSSDRPEGAAPGLLHPLNIGLTTLTVSCDDKDAVWPPEPREEGRSGNRRPSFKQAFSVLQRPSAENIGYSFVRLRATSHNLAYFFLIVYTQLRKRGQRG